LRTSADNLVRLRPTDPQGYIFRATSKANQNDPKGAEEDLKKSVDLAPNSPLGYSKLAVWRERQKKYPEAEKLFEQALEKDPNWVEALGGLTKLYAEQKQPLSKSLARVSAQVAKAPQNDGYVVMLGQFQAQSGDLKTAKSTLERALSMNKNNSAAMLLLAQIEIGSGAVNEAAANYERLVQTNPRSALPLVMLGTLEESRGNQDKAQQLYQKALDIQPDHPLAANNLAYLLMQRGGNLDVALSLAQAARRGMPENPNVADTLGWAYYLKGVYGSARDLLEEAAQKDPGNSTVQYHLGLTYDKTSQPDKANAHLKKALELSPNGPNAAAIKQALTGKRG